MRKTKARRTPSELLRHAIAERGLVRYGIAEDIGVFKTSLIRFMRGETSLRLDKADTLTDYLGPELVQRKAK